MKTSDFGWFYGNLIEYFGFFRELIGDRQVIRKEDDENIFSNLLSYFFEYSYSSFQKFAKDILKINDMGASFELVREKAVGKVEDNPSDKPKRRGKERIDIWIESDDDIIVIENKIKSGINSIVNEEQGKQSSQLNSYYAYASEVARKSQKAVHFYILAPDYAKFDLNFWFIKSMIINVLHRFFIFP